MENLLMMSAIVIFACIIFQKISGKLGVPGLFVFILLGMIFGTDGLVKIPFDDYDFANEICSVALIFIMFYGGAGTKWSKAKPVALKSVMLSSVGTVLTAGFVGVFCYIALDFELLESILTGAVICSTDAASVFSILRSKKMNLKYSTASLLEVESGSNDPFSYMLTVITLALMQGNDYGAGQIIWLLAKQVIIGVVMGFAIAYIAKQVLIRLRLKESGFDTTFVVGVAIISYALPSLTGGNGYLSVYITGIVLGNSHIPNKKGIIHFLDGVTGLMQMLLFFLLGLLAFPSRMPSIMGVALLIAIFLTFIARPIAVMATLSFFKCNIRQQLFVAWSGMRGVASIVFAIMAVTSPAYIQNDIFHIVFFIVLFSIFIQGTLLPFVAKKLDMIDEEADVMKTFTDYTDEVPVQFIQFELHKGHFWEGKSLAQIVLPPESILVLIIRNNEKIVPKGDTYLEAGDIVILSGKAGEKVGGVNLYEKEINKDDEWAGKMISEIPECSQLIVLIKRGEQVIIPKGNTVLLEGDTLVINDMEEVGIS